MLASPKAWRIILILVVATGATYWQAARWEFTLWDDPDTISANPRLHPPSVANAAYYWRHPAGGLYVPVTYTFWSALATLGMHPAIFHGANVFLHVIAVLLVFSILRQLVTDDVAACIGALIFALHPLQVESVAWASGSKDLLAAVFTLLVIDQVLRWRYKTAIVLLILGVLSKPSAVVAPIMAVVLVRARFGRLPKGATRWIALMLVISLACAIWSRLAQEQHPPTDSQWWARPLLAADAVAFYLIKLVWPVNLGIIYGRAPSSMLGSPALYLTWLLPVVVALIVWKSRRACPWLAMGAIVFVIGLLPVLGFTRFEFQVHSTVADHYMYLPMLGVAIAAAGLVALRPNWQVIALSATMMIGLSILSLFHLRHWRDSESLFTQALRVNPRSMVARDALGRAYASTGDVDRAIEQFRICTTLAPGSRLAHTNLAQALLQGERYDDAIGELEIAVQLSGATDDISLERFLLEQARRGLSARPPSTLNAP